MHCWQLVVVMRMQWWNHKLLFTMIFYLICFVYKEIFLIIIFKLKEDQLQEVLYQGDNTTFPVIEYPPNDLVNDSLIIAVDNTIKTNTPSSSSSRSTEHEL